MQRVILDTNVVISALLGAEVPTKILEKLVFEKHISICLSSEIFVEYVKALENRRYTEDFSNAAKIVLFRIEKLALHFPPEIKLDLFADQGEPMFLELAVNSDADFLLTAQPEDYKIDKLKQTRIVSPEVYWTEYKPLEVRV